MQLTVEFFGRSALSAIYNTNAWVADLVKPYAKA